MDSVHAKYEREYMMTADQHAWLSELHVARLLTTSSGQTRFLYRYAYYFFLAFYLHDGISNVKEAPALRSVLTQMLNDTYVEENSHILIFYLYLSKDRLLIEDLLRKAKESFKDYSECDLAKDVDSRTHCAIPIRRSLCQALTSPTIELRAGRSRMISRRNKTV